MKDEWKWSYSRMHEILDSKSILTQTLYFPWEGKYIWFNPYIYGTGPLRANNYSDVTMSAMAFQITGVSIVSSTVCSGADQRKYQRTASLAFVRGIHGWPVASPHNVPVTRKMFTFDDVIMRINPFGADAVKFRGIQSHGVHNLRCLSAGMELWKHIILCRSRAKHCNHIVMNNDMALFWCFITNPCSNTVLVIWQGVTITWCICSDGVILTAARQVSTLFT